MSSNARSPVHVPRCSRFVQPTKRIGKRRVIGLLLGDPLSKLPNFGTSHSRHLVRLLGDECQPEAKRSPGVLSGLQEPAGELVGALPSVSLCSNPSPDSWGGSSPRNQHNGAGWFFFIPGAASPQLFASRVYALPGRGQSTGAVIRTTVDSVAARSTINTCVARTIPRCRPCSFGDPERGRW